MRWSSSASIVQRSNARALAGSHGNGKGDGDGVEAEADDAAAVGECAGEVAGVPLRSCPVFRDRPKMRRAWAISVKLSSARHDEVLRQRVYSPSGGQVASPTAYVR